MSAVFTEVGDAHPRQVFVYLSSASVAFNIGVLLLAMTKKLMTSSHQRWGTRQPASKFWKEADDIDFEHIARLVSHAFTGLTVMAMAVVALVTTSVVKSPFVYHGDKEFILVVCSAAVGRYLFLLALEIYSGHVLTCPRDLYINYLHHLATLTCYIGVMSYSMNLFLALASLFMELDHFLYLILKIVRRKEIASPKAIMMINISGLVAALCFRVAWPIACCALAFYHQRAIKMDPGALGIMCFGMLFFGVFNIWTVKNWTMLVFKGRVKNHCCSSHEGKSIKNDLTSKNSHLNVKRDIVLDHMVKQNNLHTVRNLQSNFSNQLWSKEAQTVTLIGGVKAVNEDSDMDQLTMEDESSNI